MFFAAKIFDIPDTLPPLGMREIRGYLWFAVTGLLLLAQGVCLQLKLLRWVIIVCLAVWLLVPVRAYFKPSDSRQSEGGKRLSAQIRLYTVAVVVFLVCFAVWARRLGMAWPVLIGALFVIDAFANVIASLTEWWRLSMFGHALGLMICGFAFPFVDQSQWAFLVGGGVLTGSSLAAAILYCQVRRHEAGRHLT